MNKRVEGTEGDLVLIVYKRVEETEDSTTCTANNCYPRIWVGGELTFSGHLAESLSQLAEDFPIIGNT